MVTITTTYAAMLLFFTFLGALATVGMTLVVAILDREWERHYEPAHRIPRYVGRHRICQTA